MWEKKLGKKIDIGRVVYGIIEINGKRGGIWIVWGKMRIGNMGEGKGEDESE